jgi:hypothetical protein
MNAKDLLEIVRTRPFRPFKVHLSDGRVFEVRHPEQVLVSRSKMIVGVGEDQEYRVPDTFEHISLMHITGVTETDQPSARQPL